MLRDFQAFQDLFNKKGIEMTDYRFNFIIYQFQFFYIQAENNITFENKIDSNFIIIDENLNYNNTQEDYYILCFISLQKYTLIIIKQSDIHLLQSFLIKNEGTLIYHLRKNRKEKLHSIFKNFPIEKQSIFLDQEISNFNSKFTIKNTLLTKFWDAIKSSISGFLITKSYDDSFFERVSDLPRKFEPEPTEIKFSEDDFVFLRYLNKNYVSVKLVYHIPKGKLFVIKIQQDDNDAKLIERERRNYLEIDHLFISKYYGYGETFDQNFIISEYINGQNLEEIKQLKLSKSDKISIIYELINVFQCIHNHGFIYRDLKPDNVMIDKKKTAVLIDFDRLIKNPTDFSNVTVDFAHNYHAPEIVLGSFTNSCDIYSLGLLIYYIMTEKVPIIDLENPSKTLIDFPSEFSKLKKICEKCIQKVPTDRYTINELHDEFFNYSLYSNEIDNKTKERILDIFDNILLYCNKKVEYSKLLFSIGTTHKYYQIPENLKRTYKYYEYSANLNECVAQLKIGEYYQTKKNYDKAVYYLTMAANQNDPIAQYKLGYIYQYNLNKINKSINYFVLASNQNNSDAQYELAKIYLNGIHLNKDIKKAIYLLTLSSNQNNLNAQIKLAEYYAKTSNYQKAFHFYKLASEKNDVLSLSNLGVFYLNGIGCQRNVQKAFECFSRAAKQNDSEALFQLGHLYYYGVYVKSDINKSINYFEKASRLNHTDALFSLGCIYYDGIYVQKDIEKAIRYLSIASNLNHAKSQYNLAVIYYHDKNIKQNINKCISLLTSSFYQKYAPSQFLLGIIYYEGVHVRRDINKAINYLSLAANQNYILAQYQLGILYSEGLYVPRDINRAIHFLEHASNSNFSDATFYLGHVYFDLKKEYKKGIHYYQQSADANNSDGQYLMGALYCDGIYIERNMNKALHYLNLSASQKNQKAQFCLGVLYEKGELVKYDLNKAIYYFTLAANQNNAKARYHLGCIYIENISSIDKAIKYFTLAADQSNKDAQYCLAILYYEGNVVNRDITKAIHYFKETSNVSNQYSKNNLGIIYKLGDGVKKNISMAIEYFNEAIIKNNDGVAMFNLAHIYFFEEDVKLDIDKAISLLIKSSLLNLKPSSLLLNLVLIKKYKNISKCDIESELKNNGVKNCKKISVDINDNIHRLNLTNTYFSNILYEYFKDINIVYDINFQIKKFDAKIINKDNQAPAIYKNINNDFYNGFDII